MRIALLSALAIGVALAQTASASVMQPVQPWDGQNPFNCELQQLGQGIDYPDPGADPLCVEFDKTEQNIAPSLGLVDFLSKEPGRVAAAVPKCFYYQHDHWTGSIVQGSDPELWNWDGSYFFDKAYARGGVHVENFRIGGVPFDATPYAPPEYRPYLEESGGGVWLALDVPADPECVAMVDTPEEAAKVYRSAPVERNCADAGGNIGRNGIGILQLGARREKVVKRLGPPRRGGEHALRWCAVGGGSIGAAFGGSRTALAITGSPGHTIRNIGPRSREQRARRILEGERRFRVAGIAVHRLRHRGAPAYAGLREGRIAFIALRDRKRARSQAALRRMLRTYLKAKRIPTAIAVESPGRR